MTVFFDTSVHVDLMRARRTVEDLEQYISGAARLSPIVASELLRGARGSVRHDVEALIVRFQPIEPPSWRNAFLEAGRLLPAVFADHDEVGLANLQNDVLLALTARQTGSRLVTRDKHFTTLCERLMFDCVVLP